MLEKTEGAIKNAQSRETGNIVYTRHRTETNKAKHTIQKNWKMSNTGPTKSGTDSRRTPRSSSPCLSQCTRRQDQTVPASLNAPAAKIKQSQPLSMHPPLRSNSPGLSQCTRRQDRIVPASLNAPATKIKQSLPLSMHPPLRSNSPASLNAPAAKIKQSCFSQCTRH